jgi:hypothetical protein
LERIAGRIQTIAEQAAADAHPTVQILFLKAEVETLARIDETVLELVHKIAEVEAKSLG